MVFSWRTFKKQQYKQSGKVYEWDKHRQQIPAGISHIVKPANHQRSEHDHCDNVENKQKNALSCKNIDDQLDQYRIDDEIPEFRSRRTSPII